MSKELYRRSFDKLRTSEAFEKELLNMMENKETRPVLRPKKLIALCAAVVVVLSLAVAVSATDLMETIRIRINNAEGEGTFSYGADGSAVVVVDTNDGDVVDVVYSVDSIGETDGSQIDIDLTEPVSVAYENRDGKDILVFLDSETGETEEVDITGQIVDGEYEGILTVLGRSCTVSLTEMEDCFSISLEVSETPED